MTTTLENIFSKFRNTLRPDEGDAMGRLINSEPFQALIAPERQEIRAERVRNAAILAALDKKHAPAIAATEAAIIAAVAVEDQTREAYRAAERDLVAKRWAGIAAETHKLDEKVNAEGALIETADSREAEFIAYLVHAEDIARTAFFAMPALTGKAGRESMEMVTNRELVEAAVGALKGAAADARGRQLQVLDRQDVTEAINRSIHMLAPHLTPLQLNVIGLDVNGNLSFDKGRTQREMVRNAVTATGGRNESDAPKPATPAPIVHTGTRQVRALKAQLDRLSIR